jgi:hypothetical protein
MGSIAGFLKSLVPMDAYDVQARFAPVVFTVLPLVLLAIGVVPGLNGMKIPNGTVAGLLILALPYVATRVARSAGREQRDIISGAL